MTSHLQADADPSRWVAVRGSGIAGSRYRKAAINVLLQSTLGIVPGQPGLGLFSFIMRRGIKANLRGADGRFLVWSWKDDPSLLAVEARVTDMTPQFRAARASMPIEFDDTENFSNPHLGVGEKLVMDSMPLAKTPSVTYTWDLGAHFVSLRAVCVDKERFGLFMDPLDELARSLRWVEDLRIDENNTLRLPES